MMVDPQNYEHHFPMKFWPFFKTKWPLLVVFCSLVSLVNKIQLVKAIQPFKRPPFHWKMTFIVYFFLPLTFITINVRHIQYFFSCKNIQNVFNCLTELTFLQKMQYQYILYFVHFVLVKICVQHQYHCSVEGIAGFNVI